MDYSTRLLYKDKMHPEIYNSNIPMDQKIFLQEQLQYFGGNFDKLLEDMETYTILPEVEDYENAAIIRDYRKTIKAPLSNSKNIILWSN
jgi:protein-arginine kinase activator protein McsA